MVKSRFLKSFAIGLGLLMTTFASVGAEGVPTFHNESHGAFDVVGYWGTTTKQPTCQINTHYADKSYVSFVKNVIDAEFWIEINNKEWDFTGGGIGFEFTTDVEFYNYDKTLVHTIQSAPSIIATKDTVQLRKMNDWNEKAQDTFVNLFQSSFYLNFRDGENVFMKGMNLKGSRKAASSLWDCLKKSTDIIFPYQTGNM